MDALFPEQGGPCDGAGCFEYISVHPLDGYLAFFVHYISINLNL